MKYPVTHVTDGRGDRVVWSWPS